MPRVKKFASSTPDAADDDVVVSSPKSSRKQASPPPPRVATEGIEGLSKDDAWELLMKAWFPLIPAMAKVHAEQALEDSKQGFYVREAIFDRLFDKPRIKVDSTEHRQISVVIRPYSEAEMLDKEGKENGLMGAIIEGEARVLEIQAPAPAPPPPDNPPPQVEFNLRVVDEGA